MNLSGKWLGNLLNVAGSSPRDPLVTDLAVRVRRRRADCRTADVVVHNSITDMHLQIWTSERKVHNEEPCPNCSRPGALNTQPRDHNLFAISP